MAAINKPDQCVKNGDHWVMPLQGIMVTRCCIDSAFGIEFWESDKTTTIRIAGPFVLQEQGAAQHLSPEHPKTLGPALSLIGKTVTAVHASKDGCLAASFADGSSLSVAPDAEYEAWEVVSSKGLRVVCTPGGSLSLWQPAQENNGL